jgi:hypothetical protein
MTKCLTCGGVYAPIGADGVRYFHACPPLSDAEVAVALGVPSNPTLQTAAQQAEIAAAPRARPDARDENIVPGFVSSAEHPVEAPIKAAGKGSVEL